MSEVLVSVPVASKKRLVNLLRVRRSTLGAFPQNELESSNDLARLLPFNEYGLPHSKDDRGNVHAPGKLSPRVVGL